MSLHSKSQLVLCRECKQYKSNTEAFSYKQRLRLKKDNNYKIICIVCTKLIKDIQEGRPSRIEVDAESGHPIRNNSASTVSNPHLSNSSTPIPAVWVINPAAVLQEYDHGATSTRNHAWLDGFRYYSSFLNVEEEKKILDIVDNHTWSLVFRRRQQFYGQVYYHTTHNVGSVQPLFNVEQAPSKTKEHADQNNTEVTTTCITNQVITQGEHSTALPEPEPVSEPEVEVHSLEAFNWLIEKFYDEKFIGGDGSNHIFGTERKDFPVQILVNEYIGDMGISSHFEDVDAFGDTIATISIIQPIYMNLEKPYESTAAQHSNTSSTVSSTDSEGNIAPENKHYISLEKKQQIEKVTRVLLEPRSLFIISKNWRFLWKHGITRHANVRLPDGSTVRRVYPEGFDATNATSSASKANNLHEGYRRISLTIRHLLPGRRNGC